MIGKKNIGSALKTYRIESNLTIETLARMVGVSPSTIQKWESGTHVPQDRQAYKILKSLPCLLPIASGKQCTGTGPKAR
jgi:transcriptional regulator with XRE-family HTH domain